MKKARQILKKPSQTQKFHQNNKVGTEEIHTAQFAQMDLQAILK